MSDIDKLIAAVAAGTLTVSDILESAIPFHSERDVSVAYGGSLDAAKRLHDALLPGWDALIDLDAKVSVSNGASNLIAYRDFFGEATRNPARAWLLSILKAVRAQKEATDIGFHENHGLKAYRSQQ